MMSSAALIVFGVVTLLGLVSLLPPLASKLKLPYSVLLALAGCALGILIQVQPDATSAVAVDLLVVTHTDLAPYVGASLDVMESDTQKVREGRPYVFTDLLRRESLDEIIAFIEHAGGLQPARAAE